MAGYSPGYTAVGMGPKREVAESCFEFMHMEMVDYFKRQIELTVDNAARLDTKLSQSKLHQKLEAIGFSVGERLVERYTKEQPWFLEELEIIKFICKEFWMNVFKRQIDKLQTNYKGIYVLHDFAFRPLARLSFPGSAVDEARPYTSFACGSFTVSDIERKKARLAAAPPVATPLNPALSSSLAVALSPAAAAPVAASALASASVPLSTPAPAATSPPGGLPVSVSVLPSPISALPVPPAAASAAPLSTPAPSTPALSRPTLTVPIATAAPSTPASATLPVSLSFEQDLHLHSAVGSAAASASGGALDSAAFSVTLTAPPSLSPASGAPGGPSDAPLMHDVSTASHAQSPPVTTPVSAGAPTTSRPVQSPSPSTGHSTGSGTAGLATPTATTEPDSPGPSPPPQPSPSAQEHT